MDDIAAVSLAYEAPQVLGDSAIDGVRLVELAHNVHNQVTSGIWLVADTTGELAVLKVLAPPGQGEGADFWVGSDDPSAWNSWRREADVYRGGWPDRWFGTAAVGGPALLASFDRSDGTIALWFQPLVDPAAEWAPARHGQAAAALGLAQGDVLVRAEADPALRPPLLSKGFLRTYPESKPADRDLLVDPDTWAHPLVAHVDPAVREGLVRLHDERTWFYDLADRLPRTICHLDVWPNNLFGRPGGGIDLVDWSFTGDGALGEDPGNLVPDSVFDGFLPAASLPELDRLVWEGYRAGLEASAWDGDVRLARLGMCASAVKYHWLAPLLLSRLDEEVHLAYGGRDPVDSAHQYRERFAGLAHLVAWADEARHLAATLLP